KPGSSSRLSPQSAFGSTTWSVTPPLWMLQAASRPGNANAAPTAAEVPRKRRRLNSKRRSAIVITMIVVVTMVVVIVIVIVVVGAGFDDPGLDLLIGGAFEGEGDRDGLTHLEFGGIVDHDVQSAGFEDDGLPRGQIDPVEVDH